MFYLFPLSHASHNTGFINFTIISFLRPSRRYHFTCPLLPLWPIPPILATYLSYQFYHFANSRLTGRTVLTSYRPCWDFAIFLSYRNYRPAYHVPIVTYLAVLPFLTIRPYLLYHFIVLTFYLFRRFPLPTIWAIYPLLPVSPFYHFPSYRFYRFYRYAALTGFTVFLFCYFTKPGSEPQ